MSKEPEWTAADMSGDYAAFLLIHVDAAVINECCTSPVLQWRVQTQMVIAQACWMPNALSHTCNRVFLTSVMSTRLHAPAGASCLPID